MAHRFLVLLLVSSVYANESDKDHANDCDSGYHHDEPVKKSRYYYPRYEEEEYNDTARQIRQQKYRLKNVIVDWIPEEEDENVYEKVEDIGLRLGINKPLNDIEKAHRLNLELEGKPNPIVIRLRNMTIREKWTTQYRRKHLWEEGWYLNEHLTRITQTLLHKAKDWAKYNGYKWVWTKDCVVMVRKGPGYQPHPIRHVDDLLKLGPMPNIEHNVEKWKDVQEEMKTATEQHLHHTQTT